MGKRRMDSDLHRIKLDKGTVYQTSKGGNYYFRYQVKGERKCVKSYFISFICLECLAISFSEDTIFTIISLIMSSSSDPAE